MTRVSLVFFSFVFASVNAVAATGSAASGGKGKALGSAADTAHGSSGGGGGGSGGGGRTLRDPRKAPPLDESRKVSEQDCSKAVDPQAGNLRCK
jgi:hypothetical protein